MKKKLLLFLLLIPIFLAGCAMSELFSAGAPTPADPDIGGGRSAALSPQTAATAIAATVSAAQVAAAAQTTSAVALPALPGTEAAPQVASAPQVAAGTNTPTPAAPPENGSPALAPGGSFLEGGLKFTLIGVQAGMEKTLLSYAIEGLPANYTPAPDAGEPLMILPDGQELKTISGGGGGQQGKEVGDYVFPALPAGVKSFTLVITNNWTGVLSVWKIPVRLNR